MVMKPTMPAMARKWTTRAVSYPPSRAVSWRELDRFPDGEAGQHGASAEKQDDDVEKLLNGIVDAGLMSQTEFQRGDEVPYDLTWGQRQQGAAEVAGEQTVSEVEEAVGDQEPHGGEVDGYGAGKPAAQGGPAWEGEGEDRRGIVDLPPAHDHTGHGEGVHPMREAHGKRSSGAVRSASSFSGLGGAGHGDLRV